MSQTLLKPQEIEIPEFVRSSEAPCYVKGSFLSETQYAVVNYRAKIGYDCSMKDNGYGFCYKGKHRMLIDACGYDRFVGVL